MMNDIYKKLEFPKEVNIMGIDYKIVLVDKVVDDNYPNKSLAGLIKYSKAEIHIWEVLDNAQKWQTLFHEMLHGIFDANHLEGGSEETIDLVANGLMCGFFNSNWRLK